ncbi:helix-turn-helix transcriptional regulator [Streptomyces sp. ODS28]|uniref:helix-turn-helix domain-containing protein n=1 Tax=Streptomyces sp. ODS28 TaxID=3136688 RepID=UPI0031EF7F0F
MTAVPQPDEPGLAPVAQLPGAKREAASRFLGEQLRQLRQARGLSLKDVAPVIRGSISKISRMERGESPPKERDVLDLARHYGVSAEQYREIEYLLKQISDEAWYQQYSDVTPAFLRRLIGLEGSAEEISTYENNVVPGILQIKDYARALITAALPDSPKEEIERKTDMRAQRKMMLKGSHPKVNALLDEGVLRRPVGGPSVMCQQLEYLLFAARVQGVNIRVIEFENGAAVSPPHPITHLKFFDGGPAELVYIEHLTSATYLTRPTEVDAYRHVLNELRFAATKRANSEEILERALQEYRNRC